MNRISKKEIESVREIKMGLQKNLCMLCNVDLTTVKACLDHDHKTGQVRDVLCLNCNGIEGKIFNLSRRAKRNGTEINFLNKIINYWESHAFAFDLLGDEIIIHPNHKTVDEKRLAKNKKARVRRQKNK